MNSFKVALLQIMPECDLEKNRDKGLEYCRRAKKMGADLALFPEMWSSGYVIPEDIRQLKALAVSADSSFVRAFSEEARRLDTASGNVKVGAMICYDREFPESARILMLKGAEIILVPNACPMEINRLTQLRARAFENMTGIATANYPYGQPDCNGHSSAFDGIAYRTGESSSRDTLVIEAGEREGIYVADFPIDELRAYRSTGVHGNAYRCPEIYKILTESKIQEPFIRPDYRNRRTENKNFLTGVFNQ